MKHIILIIVFFLSFSLTKAQRGLDYGLSLIYNMSSQTNYNPQVPDDGTFQWNTLSSFGIGVIVGKPVSDKFYWTNRFLYQQKGYTEEAQTAYVNGEFQSPLSYHTLQNRFGYLTFESNIGYRVIKFKSFKITPHVGLNVNYLLHQNIESERVDPINASYPTSEYNGNWKKINLGYNVGVTCSLQEKINLGFEFQRSLTPLLKTDNLIVKDWTWSIKMDILFSKIFSKRNS